MPGLRAAHLPTMATMQPLPLLAVVMPCYNSAAYMARGLDSVIDGAGERFGQRIEVIVVDDGSADATAEVARGFAQRHPGVVRLVQQDNGGHGAAVMAGIAAASALYVKVLDSDDRLDPAALQALLSTLDSFPTDGQADVVITDYIYDNVRQGSDRRIQYRRCLPARRTITWEQTARPRTGSYFLMHALTYKRSVLVESGLELPRHTFYVDNLYASVPLQHTRTLHYLPVPLYWYFIGREDQSVNEAVAVRRLDQQLRVNRLMIDELATDAVRSPALTRYLLHYLSIVTSVSLTFCVLAGTDAARAQGRDLLAHLKAANPAGYRAYRRSPMNVILSARGPGSHRFIRTTYRVVRKRFGFN